MSILESFRDSRAVEGAGDGNGDGGGDGGGLLLPATAVPAPAAANAGVEMAATREGLNGHDVVFAIVLTLYCCQREQTRQQQQRRQGERSRGRRGRKSCASGDGGTDGDTTDGDGDGGGGCSARSGKGEASAVYAGAVATVVDPAGGAGVAAATACGHDPEGETESLVRELQEARGVHPREVEFYLPQLCMIVGLGDFTRPPALVEFLLELCQSDLRLAHKIHWFLKSFCSGGGSSLAGLSSFALRVQKRGCAVASRLSRALVRQAMRVPVSDRGVGRPQQRDVIGRDSRMDGGGTDGVVGQMEAQDAGEEKPGYVGPVWRGASEEEAEDEEEEKEEEDDSLAEHYDPAMFFVEALLGLAEQLGALSPKKRAKGLQEGLEGINEFFLSERAQGSDVIYVPFGEGFHQIRAIHPRESMHFSTKERVPLLVCLEVQQVRVPTATARSAAKSGRKQIPITVITGGHGAEAMLVVEGEADMKGGHETEGGAEHAGEAGLMERFRGTVQSFVKLRSDKDNEGKQREDKRHHQGHESVASPLGHHDPGDTIEVDECSSRTASEPDLGDSRDSGCTSDSNPRRRPLRSAAATEAAASGNFQEHPNTNDDSDVKEIGDENDGDGDEEDELEYEYEDEEDCGDFDCFEYDDEGEDHGGASSQGGFWYGEGGGASALEAALGQWGGYLDVTVAVAAEDDSGATSAAAAAGGVDPEDESWEIVDAPVHWEGDSKRAAPAAAGGGDIGSGSGSGCGSGCGSDSYSEYLAAAEAEQRDCQLAAEAEEAEQATLKAEVEAEAGGVPPLTKQAVGGRESGIKTGASPGVAACGLKPTGSYFAPVAGVATAAVKGAVMSAGAAGGVVGRERRRRRRGVRQTAGVAAGEPRIIFKERWREKEQRVWQEGRGSGSSAVTAEVAASEAFCQREGGGEGKGSGEPSAVESERGGSLPLKGWNLLPIIVKANDDLRQEQFVSNLVAVFDQIFSKAQLGARLRPYEIMATSPTTGVIEAIPDTVSLDALKRHTHHLALHEFFRRHFGRKGMLREARANFVESCAAYSVVCYLLQIKDRHNGNILLSADGHLIHIDWGFSLDLSPGGNLGFESAPFKLTQEFVEVMGGARSSSFLKYRRLCVRAFLEARRSRDKIITLVEIMMAFRPDLACFGGRPEVVLKHLRARFQPDKSPESCVTFIHELIQQSVDNWRTRLYDTYQRAVGGIQ